MVIDMPAGDCNIKFSRIWDLHLRWEFLHAFAEFFRPLTTNVVRENDSEDYDANNSSEDTEVHIAESKCVVISPGRD